MGSQAYVLAIDQGTTSTRAILFDTTGRARATAQTELTQHHPGPGWVEHDPEEIWRSVASTCGEVIAVADGPIAAIGIANQRETTVLWERATGRPVHNAIVWQDRRTAEAKRAVSKASSILRGTEGSNPISSAAESVSRYSGSIPVSVRGMFLVNADQLMGDAQLLSCAPKPLGED